MKEEIRKVLEMVEQGKVNSAQAVELLEAMGLNDDAAPEKAVRKPEQKRLLKISVNKTGGDKVDVKVPISLLQAGMGIGKNFAVSAGQDNPAMKDLDWDQLMLAINQMVEDGTSGEIVTVDSAAGDHVKIWLE